MVLVTIMVAWVWSRLGFGCFSFWIGICVWGRWLGLVLVVCGFVIGGFGFSGSRVFGRYSALFCCIVVLAVFCGWGWFWV